MLDERIQLEEVEHTDHETWETYITAQQHTDAAYRLYQTRKELENEAFERYVKAICEVGE